MIIKYEGMKDGKIADRYDSKIVSGTRIDNGEAWEKEFFANQSSLVNAFSEFGVGEVINITMKKDGKFWKISEDDLPAVASEALIEAAQKNDVRKGAPSGGGGGGGYQKKAWDGRKGDAYDHSAAIYLAFDFLKYNAEFATKKSDKVVTEEMLYAQADKFFNYINKGINPTVDPLEPPA